MEKKICLIGDQHQSLDKKKGETNMKIEADRWWDSLTNMQKKEIHHRYLSL